MTSSVYDLAQQVRKWPRYWCWAIKQWWSIFYGLILVKLPKMQVNSLVTQILVESMVSNFATYLAVIFYLLSIDLNGCEHYVLLIV